MVDNLNSNYWRNARTAHYLTLVLVSLFATTEGLPKKSVTGCRLESQTFTIIDPTFPAARAN